MEPQIIIVKFEERKQVHIRRKDSRLPIAHIFITRAEKKPLAIDMYEDGNKINPYVGSIYDSEVILEDAWTGVSLFPTEPADGAGASLDASPEVKQDDPDNARCL